MELVADNEDLQKYGAVGGPVLVYGSKLSQGHKMNVQGRREIKENVARVIVWSPAYPSQGCRNLPYVLLFPIRCAVIYISSLPTGVVKHGQLFRAYSTIQHGERPAKGWRPLSLLSDGHFVEVWVLKSRQSKLPLRDMWYVLSRARRCTRQATLFPYLMISCYSWVTHAVGKTDPCGLLRSSLFLGRYLP